MIVLDSLSQYLLYEVEPPKSLPFYSSYIKVRFFPLALLLLQIMSTRKSTHEEEQALHYARVSSMWQRRIAWFETQYRGNTFQPNVRNCNILLLKVRYGITLIFKASKIIQTVRLTSVYQNQWKK